MTIGRIAVVVLAAVLAMGGIGTAFAALGSDDDPERTGAIELRKDDATEEDAGVQDDDEPEPDPGDGDRTRGNDGTRGGDNTYVGDGDATWGDDGSAGGDNSYVAPAYNGGGGSYSGGGDT